MAEDAARELPTFRSKTLCRSSSVSTPSAGRRKLEKAALRWLERCLTEGEPRLGHFTEVAADLAKLGG